MPTGNRMLPGGDLENCKPWREPHGYDFLRTAAAAGSLLILNNEAHFSVEERAKKERRQFVVYGSSTVIRAPFSNDGEDDR